MTGHPPGGLHPRQRRRNSALLFLCIRRWRACKL